MKTYNKIIYAILFSLFVLTSNGQIKKDRPVTKGNTSWIISKDVQKISNRNLLDNEYQLTIESVGTPALAISKDVQKAGKSKNYATSGNLISKGYPAWIISKPVQQIGR